ncbi:MAG: pyridoxamine 5'-phosphate oxidase family protein [Alphaproteobacteria bacterium]|nr:pyridoxamine 5'-phosphate oxidase family protein [Alphaproteobacteria bacterium]
MEYIQTVDDLAALYGEPLPTSLSKVADYLTHEYHRWIMAAKFCVLSTVGPDGTDGTPRGDDGPVVAVLDAKTLLLPDWAGNNRIDSLSNIIRDSRLSVMFMVQGSNNVVRVNGRGKITVDEQMQKGFAKGKKLPRSVLVITIDEVYFQCAKAVMRADLWGEPPDNSALPTAGDFIKAMTKGREGGAQYDANYATYAKPRMWERP